MTKPEPDTPRDPSAPTTPSSPEVPTGWGPADAVYRGTVAISTHGCKLNQADSDRLARGFAEAGYRIVDSPDQADVFVLNTCTVTATADAKARRALRGAARDHPQAVIVATGCYAQRARPELERLDGISLVVGNPDKEKIPSMVTALLAEKAAGGCQHPLPLAGVHRNGSHRGQPIQPAPATAPGRTRAMVKIQEGCNQVCAYCIVPKVRGRERSVPPETLVEEINHRVAQGCQEVVLTGSQLGTYGLDATGTSLHGLLVRVLGETTVPRLRVSSLQPQEITSELLDLWQDRRLCRHFHIPLQSGSDRTLRAMRRRYTTAMFARTVELVRRTVPGCGITTDLIVGFPGEEEREFQESQAFAQAMGFSDIHLFPFSPRPGTSAVYLGGQVQEPMIKHRFAQMLEVATKGFRAFRRSQLGQTLPVLWETVRGDSSDPRWSGLTDNYIRVYTRSQRNLRNTITPANLLELSSDEVSAQIP